MTPLGSRYDSSHSAAVESAVDAYATKLLRMKSPPEACIDDSLGPYVTSMLRCCNQTDDVKDLEEFESLMELLEEHCALSAFDASSALSTIANAVRTGNVPVDPTRIVSLEDLGVAFDDPLAFNADYNTNYSNPQASDNHVEVETSSPFPDISGNPLRSPDKFIPVDLMGVLDDPATPVPHASEPAPKQPEPEAFPPLGSSAPPPTGNIPKKIGKPPRKPSKEVGKDLAAVFFRPTSRSRQQSIDENDSFSSTSPKQTSLGDIGYQAFPLNDEQQNYYHYQQVDSAVEMLLAVNADLSEGAAREASALGNADVNVAQYVIDQAMAAPPVCRHMLNDGCYRSDCQFSHDVDGHTCLFWLRGRCGKGDSCRFRHGFSPKLLEGIKLSPPPPPLEASKEHPYQHSGSNPLLIATKNLLSHNQEIGTPSTNSWSAGSGFSSMRGYYLQSQGHHSVSNGWDDFPTASTSLDSKSISTFSFASVATKGYKNSDSFAAATGSTALSSQKPKPVKIPQDMWNAHINRDATAFHIQDPLERYMEVSKAVARSDTIDLHFQSTSSFSLVLAKILPLKLREHNQVWVVTGSGHHVARDSHQKGGGVLETAVLNWLDSEGYYYHRGRDRNGHSGAVLVRCTR